MGVEFEKNIQTMKDTTAFGAVLIEFFFITSLNKNYLAA